MILRPTPKGNIKGSHVLVEAVELLWNSAWGKSSQGCSKFWGLGSSGPSAKLRLKATRKQRRSKKRRVGFSPEDP
jgi:hypothetical protein